MINIDNRNRIEACLQNVDDSARIEYERRLSLPYSKGSKPFKKQFMDGGGSELEKKFWSRISSSRLCFDLYSWLAINDNCIKIEFEYKLPKLGRLGVPNMDVYIETSDEVWYIESKFTETVKNQNFGKVLPEQYWKEVDERGNEIVGGGFHTTEGKYRDTTILQRFRGNKQLQEAFQLFCRETEKQSMLLNDEDWFDAKQETCHILGIILELLHKKDDAKFLSKKIHFSNIVYSFSEPPTEFAENFIARAKNLVKQITDIDIIYDINYMQDIIKQYGDQEAYGTNGLTVSEQISKHFGPIF